MTKHSRRDFFRLGTGATFAVLAGSRLAGAQTGRGAAAKEPEFVVADGFVPLYIVYESSAPEAARDFKPSGHFGIIDRNAFPPFDIVTLPELHPDNEELLRAKLVRYERHAAERLPGARIDIDGTIASMRDEAKQAGHGDFAYDAQQRDILESTRQQLKRNPEYDLIGHIRVFTGVGPDVDTVFGHTAPPADAATAGEAYPGAIYITVPHVDYLKAPYNRTCAEELFHNVDLYPNPLLSRKRSISGGLSLQTVAHDIARLKERLLLSDRWNKAETEHTPLSAADRRLTDEWNKRLKRYNQGVGVQTSGNDRDEGAAMLDILSHMDGESAIMLDRIKLYERTVENAARGAPGSEKAIKSEYMVKILEAARDRLATQETFSRGDRDRRADFLNPDRPEYGLMEYLAPGVTDFVRKKYIPQIRKDLKEMERLNARERGR